MLVEAWRESKVSIEAFARELGVGAWRFRYWVPRLDEHVSARTSDATERTNVGQRLVPAVVSVGQAPREPSVVIRLPDQIDVEIYDVIDGDPEELGRFVAALRRATR